MSVYIHTYIQILKQLQIKFANMPKPNFQKNEI